ncbi:hypothetical protein [Paenarthrobacter nitroguajacolicus]|uniref:hypothetical protein n=1 Tax=Paenarthrobacter nitroguajacolicus TaxID=211146 RepID=UPI004053B9F2
MTTLNIVAGLPKAGLVAEEVDLMIAANLRAPHSAAARRHQPTIPVPAAACQN